MNDTDWVIRKLDKIIAETFLEEDKVILENTKKLLLNKDTSDKGIMGGIKNILGRKKVQRIKVDPISLSGKVEG